MTQTDFGPVNIRRGNSAVFTVQFFDVNGNTTTPLSATLALSYTDISNAAQTDNVTLLPNNSFLVGTWGSSGTPAQLVPWTVTAVGASSVAQSGIIRVYDP